MSLIGNVGPFVEGKEDFECYLARVNAFFTANDVKEDKVSSCLAIMESKLYSLVVDLVSPKSPQSCTFDEIVNALTSHFKPQVVIIFERFKFYSRNQGPSESVADFVAGIKSCARSCEFGDSLEEALRDRWVMGLRNESTQRALLTVKDLTFAQVVETATSCEAAAKDVVEIGSGQTASGSSQVNQVNTVNVQSKSKPQRNSSNFGKSKVGSGDSKPMNACSGCGNMHWKRNCPFKFAKCYRCGHKGHVRKVCKTKVTGANRTDVNVAVSVDENKVNQAVNDDSSTGFGDSMILI